ncbi:uncharacterized protein LOC127253580 [Andrographis paniculata]|uniref:uncharacterized protein LOC127253580 n=1 Tax=Andrographis paniculata TaxID=175694 RepID=UPI0021E917F0|nr:uncharacterized protein LOC127253580 [Andrographis paniculata]
MGNAICFRPPPASPLAAKIISYGGGTRCLTGKHFAGEIMFQWPDRVVCHADSFFIGRPIPSLAIDDELHHGQTYFVLPLDSFPHSVLSPSSLATLGCSRRAVAGLKECPFEYVRGSNGAVSIKVKPEYIARLIGGGENKETATATADGGNGCKSPVCSSPELQKHYDQLVGPRDRIWSPKLETISESKIRVSPCRIFGLDWKR